MVKLIVMYRRAPDTNGEGSAEIRGAGSLPGAVEPLPALRRYVFNVVEHNPPDEVELDAIGELSCDSAEALDDLLRDSPVDNWTIGNAPASRGAETAAYLSTEHIQRSDEAKSQLGTRSPGVKLICPIRRRADMTHEAFADHWLHRHVPLALKHHPGLVKYVTNVVDKRLSGAGAEWDGISELHFAGMEYLLGGMFDNPEGEQIVRADIERFIGYGCAYRVAEYVRR